MHVINYDLPNSDQGGIDEYVHRIGMSLIVDKCLSFFDTDVGSVKAVRLELAMRVSLHPFTTTTGTATLRKTSLKS